MANSLPILVLLAFVLSWSFLVSAQSTVARVSTESPESFVPSGFAKMEPIVSMIYENRSFPVYKVERLNKTVYYYTPPVLVDPETAIAKYNKLRKRHELSFEILMWDENYKSRVREAVKTVIKSTLPENDLRLLPIALYKVSAANGSFPGMQLAYNWTSYIRQPSTIHVRYVCDANETCQDAMDTLRTSPEDFFPDLTISYSFSGQEVSDADEPLKVSTQRRNCNTQEPEQQPAQSSEGNYRTSANRVAGRRL